MFVFGHVGITVGTSMIADAVTFRRLRSSLARRTPVDFNGKAKGQITVKPKRVLPIRDWMDYRLLMVGSLLPDIIDKPLGQYILRDQLSYGRVYSHSVLFLLALSVPGVWLFDRRGNSWLLILAFGSLMHHLEDQMWRWPRVWLWPLEGGTLPREDLNGWFPNMIHAVITYPETYIPELIGIGFLVFAAIRVFRGKRFVYALRTGQMA